jgi:hypothetical protein
MLRLCVSRLGFRRASHFIAIVSLALGACAYGQESYINLEVHVSDLPTLPAHSKEPSDVLVTSLGTILQDREVCCGKDSALDDSLQRADPASLPDIAAKLQGRQLLSDGRPIMVTAKYIAPDALNAYLLLETLQEKHALLMQWRSHFYVCYGVTYRKDYDANGAVTYTILTFRLIDTRYSDARREVVFDRATDDWTKVQGVLWVESVRQ